MKPYCYQFKNTARARSRIVSHLRLTSLVLVPTLLLSNVCLSHALSRKEIGVTLIYKNRNEQDRTVVGVVSDSKGMPLVGVSVQVKDNPSLGTKTDSSGRYRIEDVPKGAQLTFSFLGYKTHEESLQNRTTVDITLIENTSQLDEVVVVGYGQQKRANLTGSVATVNNEKLIAVPVASTAQALSGRLPGLITKQSQGSLGASPSISIRGFGSALVIVDGVEQANFQNIDPNEIESISILKDAAAAVYGARAGNGVVLVTTRRGKAGKAQISLTSSSSLQKPTFYPEYVDSWDYAIIQNEASAFAGLKPVYTAEEIQKFRDGNDPAYPNTKHYDNIIKPWSLMQTNNLNVSGGSENVNYFLSGGYLLQDAIYKSDGVNLNRFNIRSNVDITVADHLRVGLDLASRYTINKDVQTSTQNIFQAIGTTTNRFPGSYPDPTKTPYVGRNSISPYILMDPDLSGYNNTDRNYLTGALSLNYEAPFLKGLTATLKGNYVGDNSYNKLWTIPFSTYYYDYENDIYTVAASGGKYSLTERQDRSRELTLQSMLAYENTIGDHEVKALFVNEIIDARSNWFDAYKDGFISNSIDQMFAGATNPLANGSAFEESRMSFVGRLNYGYKSKYLLESTVRYDGSSRFAPQYRWAWFPSVSVGWRISEEQFVKENLSFVDNLKLRLSYSNTGYDRNAAAYQYQSTFGFNTQYVFGSAPYKTLRTNGIDNASISWEDIYTYNGGLEVDLWKGLIGAELDVFYRLREGVLGTRTDVLPNTFGATLPQENINAIDDRGFELILKHRNKINDFEYSVNANFSFARSKYVRYAEQEFTDPDLEYQQKRTGQWVDRTFGYRTDGFFNSQEEITSSGIDYDLKGNSTIKPGMIRYVDINDDKKIDWRDRQEIGRGTFPQTMFGLNFDFKYKGFDLSMLWQGAGSYSVEFNNNMRTLSINNVWNSYKFLYDGRWTPENKDKAQFPVTTNGANTYMNVTSDMWLRRGDYIRLKDFSVGYTLPPSLISRVGISRARVYVTGYNVLTFDKLGGIPYDPEGVGSSWAYPLYKSYSLGLNITL
ncbi:MULTISPECIES: SusC/RagA family TonB-linked outer membrane protein [Sphingobacterium]|uniref:SusC/RagA family TonB-linked outer membrane protein n=1 Tax=Sphingobacterium TaxID=28453 RepID=UPI0013DA7D7D|nr:MULTISPECIES: TonB-dependent receptor [unclassified Sphingobacterium]